MTNEQLTQEEIEILFKNNPNEKWYKKSESLKDMVERIEHYNQFYKQERNDIYINRFYQERFK
jgi:hypothetical protein